MLFYHTFIIFVLFLIEFTIFQQAEQQMDCSVTENEIVLNPVYVHDYCLQGPSKETDDPGQIKRVPLAHKQRRVTKTKRLEESLKSNERFLKITEANLETDKMFKEKQLEIMLTKSNNKQAYYEKKLLHCML